MRYIYVSEGEEKLAVGRIIMDSVLAVLFLIILFGSFRTVSAGYRGIKTRFSAVTSGVLDEGLHFKFPIIEKIIEFPVQIQKEQVDASAASKDLQSVSAQVALNYHIAPDQVAKLYQKVRLEYKERLIAPALQESIKASTANYTAEELITKRAEVRDSIEIFIKNKLADDGIIVDEFNIVNFDFSQSFNAAIEAKVTAEQDALAAKNKLEQVKYEAQQRIEEAKGKAEAIRVESSALQNNPQVLQLRALEKWDGILPRVTSSAIPFIDVSKE